ncbi:MAG: hypothetical protein ACO3RV_00355 [Luteolibacter sp.]
MHADQDVNLMEAERIAALLLAEGLPAVVIGAAALAAHRYVRSTRDIDLGVDADIGMMRRLVEVLGAAGYDAEFHEPDVDDPLGGVIDVSGDFGLIQVVNFGNRFPAVIRDALVGEDTRMRPDGVLRIMPIPQLVALKLYAGGWKSLADIVELLRRNPEADLEMIGETCRRYRLRGWDKVLEELRQAP